MSGPQNTQDQIQLRTRLRISQKEISEETSLSSGLQEFDLDNALTASAVKVKYAYNFHLQPHCTMNGLIP